MVSYLNTFKLIVLGVLFTGEGKPVAKDQYKLWVERLEKEEVYLHQLFVNSTMDQRHPRVRFHQESKYQVRSITLLMSSIV